MSVSTPASWTPTGQRLAGKQQMWWLRVMELLSEALNISWTMGSSNNNSPSSPLNSG
ncbi:hypothetical protein LEMLEM_LOCUS9980 [Lemmus lemmus]